MKTINLLFPDQRKEKMLCEHSSINSLFSGLQLRGTLPFNRSHSLYTVDYDQECMKVSDPMTGAEIVSCFFKD